ncbi:MAG: CHAT domain-containing protein [Xenococcaceae cyanobacterium MO_188.B32]|nr:CHAT domain-containing protein [Xenococcaceae cyanobacterium MO_188.B32]
MARKWHSFYNAVGSVLKGFGCWLRKNCQRYLVLFVLGIFLTTGLTPVLSQVPTDNARQLVQQGENNYRAGDFVSAVNYLEEAIKLFENQKDWQNLAITLTNLGRLQLSLGKPELALENWQKATSISERQLNNRPGKIRNQIYQAEALQKLGLYNRACNQLQSALELDSNTCEDLTVETLKTAIEMVSPIQINGWRSLGNVLRLLGKLEESELVLHTVAQSSSDTDPAATRVSLGNTLRARGNIIRDRQSSPKYDYLPWRCEVIEPESSKFPQEARDFHQQAQQQYSEAIAESNLGNTRISAQLNLLDLILETTPTNSKQTTLVNNLLSEIDFSNLSINKATIYAQINLAKSQACLAGRLHSSPDWQKIRQILIQAQQNAQSISNVHLESYALGNLGRLYEYRAWWLDNLSSEYFAEKHQELEQQQPSQICQTAQDCRQEAIKLTSTALLLAQSDATPQIAYQWQWQLGRLWATEGNRQKAIAFYEAATKTLESVRSDLINLDSDVQFSFRDDVEPLYRQLIDLLLTTGATSEADTQDFPTQALEIIDFLRLSELENFLQCSLAPELQVETVVGEIDPQAAFIYPLILSDRLEIIFKLPQQPLAHRATFIQHTEVEATVEKLQSYLKQSRFTEEVKQEAQKAYQWIIQPIEQDLEKLRQSGQVSTLVFVLDDTLRDIPLSVLYNQEEYLVEKYALAVIPNRQLFDPRPRQKRLQVLTAGVSEGQIVDGIEFAALPYVPSELADIQQLADISTEPLLNQTFTEGKLEQQIDSASFPIVHIATHGEFSSDPDETYILVWGKRVKVRDLDQILQINNPDSPQIIELLILSACETAQGNRRAALGLAGIAAQARVRTTLASLWKVNDLATAEFMTKFYEALRDGATVAQALQQTQIYFLSEPDLRRPYFWAPFVIVGNWL